MHLKDVLKREKDKTETPLEPPASRSRATSESKMNFRDVLKREKDRTETPLEPPNVTFMRTDTNTQEIISPPSFDQEVPMNKAEEKKFSRFRSSSNVSTSSKSSNKSEKRLSQRFHLRSSSRESQGSVNVPSDLPEIQDLAIKGEEQQAQWEERATILAKENPHNPRPVLSGASPSRSKSPNGRQRSISNAKGDETIQEAIRLHEAGKLSESTAMFRRLVNDNAMAQIMYGLALRHGWGIDPNPQLAVKFLSEAAANSAQVEASALKSGIQKGGAAKGELVLAIYELANSFQHGWGVSKDPVAARKYYECAANMGDTDAMNEVARCYEHGIGGSKDKHTAAQYYRLAENSGHKTIGNSWIWKPKYEPKPTSAGSSSGSSSK